MPEESEWAGIHWSVAHSHRGPGVARRVGDCPGAGRALCTKEMLTSARQLLVCGGVGVGGDHFHWRALL